MQKSEQRKNAVHAIGARPDLFFKTFGWDGARERTPLLRERGIGKAGDFEMSLGHHVGNLKK